MLHNQDCVLQINSLTIFFSPPVALKIRLVIICKFNSVLVLDASNTITNSFVAGLGCWRTFRIKLSSSLGVHLCQFPEQCSVCVLPRFLDLHTSTKIEITAWRNQTCGSPQFLVFFLRSWLSCLAFPMV